MNTRIVFEALTVQERKIFNQNELDLDMKIEKQKKYYWHISFIEGFLILKKISCFNEEQDKRTR